ncbi:MAG: hypothetical protein JMM75_00510 [Candidatus Xiphinematobacter sp.]|nr:MAG: hypothetical protein JMM75_00510 [Candidatus Xiphinematobacter sp.]
MKTNIMLINDIWNICALMNAEFQSVVAIGIVSVAAALLLRGAMRKRSSPCRGGCGCRILKKSFLRKVNDERP